MDFFDIATRLTKLHSQQLERLEAFKNSLEKYNSDTLSMVCKLEEELLKIEKPQEEKADFV